MSDVKGAQARIQVEYRAGGAANVEIYVDNKGSMNNIALINAIDLSPYAFDKIGNDTSAFQKALEYGAGLPDVDRIVCLADRKLDIDLPQIVKERWNVKELLGCMVQEAAQHANVFYFYADCPFLSGPITERMYRNHLSYFADYSFADGYPYGLTPEIIKRETLSHLVRLNAQEEASIKRESLFDVIKKDINAFDIETEIAPKDLRMLRVALTTDSRRNVLLLTRLLGHGARDADSIQRVLEESPLILRTYPAFFNIQIVEGCPQNCVYCPYPAMRGAATGKMAEMELGQFQDILDRIESSCGDAVISLSLWGEPAFHSQAAELVTAVSRKSSFDLIVESSGIGWERDVLLRIKREARRCPTWIVSLDAWSPEIYRQLRGDGFDEALKTVDILCETFPGQVYVQAVRMKENEDDLEQFYRGWKAKLDSLIIQKYDHFCRALPDRRVTDLSPLKRIPCWHIKRDMIILLNGAVVLCREDLEKKHVLGNIGRDGLESIWEQGLEIYRQHLHGVYPDICKECDEYYTYNF